MKLSLKNEIILLDVCEDVIDLCFFQSLVKEILLIKENNKIKKTTLDILANFLEKKYVNIGKLTENGIKSFKGDSKQIMNQIKEGWDSLKEEINIGEIAWIGISPNGKERLFYLLKKYFKNRHLEKSL